MHFRKVLTTIGAIAAAGALTLAPTAANAAISEIEVDGSTADVDYPISGVLKSATAEIEGFDPLGCSSGDVGGVVHGGPGVDPAFTFDQLDLDCESFYPGGAVTMSAANCDIEVAMDPASSSGPVVTGKAYMSDRTTGTDCVEVDVSPPGCTVDVGGSIDVSFDETIKTVGGVDYQELTLDGSGLTMENVTGLCALVISDGTPLDLNAVFNIEAIGTGIDFLQ